MKLDEAYNLAEFQSYKEPDIPFWVAAAKSSGDCGIFALFLVLEDYAVDFTKNFHILAMFYGGHLTDGFRDE